MNGKACGAPLAAPGAILVAEALGGTRCSLCGAPLAAPGAFLVAEALGGTRGSFCGAPLAAPGAILVAEALGGTRCSLCGAPLAAPGVVARTAKICLTNTHTSHHFEHIEEGCAFAPPQQLPASSLSKTFFQDCASPSARSYQTT